MVKDPWQRFQEWTDSIVDQWWAEPVEIHPWDTGQGVSSEGAPDPNRPVLKTAGVLCAPDARVIAMGQAFGANTRMLEQDLWLSIQQNNIVSLVNYKAYDRVFLPNRGEWYEINYPSPSVTRRPRYYLTRMQPGSPTS